MKYRMSYLPFVLENIAENFPDVKKFRGKDILLVGGYTALVPSNVREGGGKNVYIADSIKETAEHFEAASVKKASLPELKAHANIVCDYVCEFEEFADNPELQEKFDVVFVMEGLEKVANPAKALAALRGLAKEGGQMIFLARTTAELGTAVRLDYYEDSWRFSEQDFKNFFKGDKNFETSVSADGGIFQISFRKRAENFAPDENFKFFHCRVQRPVTFAESLNFGYFRDQRSLVEIANLEPTDKVDHGYLDKYEFVLKKFKDDKFNLLELGVFDGGSLRMWKRYFPNAEIFGVDIDPRCAAFAEERIQVQIADLSDMKVLERLIPLNAKVIIDDASHIWSHQLKSMCILFPFLQSGGVFIMEDMETSVNQDLFPGFDDIKMSAYDFCERVARVVMSKRPDAFGDPISKQITGIGMMTEFIAMIKGSCIMIKR